MKITIDHLDKEFQHKKVLKGIELSFEEGKIYGLLGRNGAGKSTLLNIINNRLFPTNGTVVLDGKNVTDSEKVQNHFYLMSDENLYPSTLTIDAIYRLTEKFYGAFDWEFARELIQKFDVEPKDKFKKLSTGYRTIVKLIAALCVPSDFVFLDEPVLGLDANHRELFYSTLLAAYEKRQRTFVISTHLIEEVADLLEEVVIIDQGKVLRNCPAEEISGEGKTISGPTEAVEAFASGMKILGKETLGGLTSIYIAGNIDKPVPDNLRVTPLTLQAYFIQLTNKEEES